MAVAAKKAAPRGRPRTGVAKTSTERAKALETGLLAAGGRILSRVRLGPEAAAALAALAKHAGTDRAAIEHALIEQAKNIK